MNYRLNHTLIHLHVNNRLCHLHICILLEPIEPTQSRISVLYGGPTLNYGRQLSLYFPHMLRVNMTRDLAHLQLSDLQGEITPTCRTSELQGERILIRRT